MPRSLARDEELSARSAALRRGHIVARQRREERARADPYAKVVRFHLEMAMSHRAMSSFYQDMADDEPNPQRRAIHLANAASFLRQAQEAEAQVARAMPAAQQRALVPSSKEHTP